MKRYLSVLVLLQWTTEILSIVPVYDISFINVYDSQNGYGWPPELYVLEGQQMLIKLSKTLTNFDSCIIVTPQGDSFDVSNPPNSRFERWNDCGLRVRNINVTADEGRWKITVHRAYDDTTVKGIVEVNVLDPYHDTIPETLTLEDGSTDAQLRLTELPNSYCVLTQPFSQSSLIPGLCEVNVDVVSRALRGTWEVVLGLPGSVSEVHVTKDVSVKAENLRVGYSHSSGKLNMFCNLEHSQKNITFCRFQRVSSAAGYNVKDGLSDGHFSYYGKGFGHRECGLTVEDPTADDYSPWRCSVGLYELVNNDIVDVAPMQALINPVEENQGTSVRSYKTTLPTKTVVTQRHTSMTLTCNADVSLSYCWFMDPLGNTYTPLKKTSDEQEFWYTGEGYSLGECGIVFKTIDDNFSGNWVCHMGPSSQRGVEITDVINVKVTGPLAAESNELQVVLGEKATLHCETADGKHALNYCRFLSPKSVGINIDESVTVDQAILNNYYFTPDNYVDFGACSLTIISVSEDDLGKWTCAATLSGDTAETMDHINLYVDRNDADDIDINTDVNSGKSRRYKAGVASGVITSVALLGGVFAFLMIRRYKKRPSNCSQVQLQNLDNVSGDSVSIGENSVTSENSGIGVRNI